MNNWKKKTVIEFVDDVNVLTYSTSTKENCRIFEKLHEIFTTWFRRHEAIFFSKKYELIYFNKSSKKFNMQTMINLKKLQLISKTNIRILKLQINTKLKWKSHVKNCRVIVEKGNEKTISSLLTCGKGNPSKKFPFTQLKIFFSRSGKWKKNLFPSHKKSLILLILVGKNSFFSDFFSCEKGNSKKSLPFPHAEREIPQKNFPFSMKEGKLKKQSSREMRDAGSRIPSLFFAVTQRNCKIKWRIKH